MKRIFCLFLAVCLATLVGVPIASAESEGPFQYYAGQNEATIFNATLRYRGIWIFPKLWEGFL